MPSIGDPGLDPNTNVWYSGYDEVVEECLSGCGATITRYSLERPEETLGARAAGAMWNQPVDAEWVHMQNMQVVPHANAPALGLPAPQPFITHTPTPPAAPTATAP